MFTARIVVIACLSNWQNRSVPMRCKAFDLSVSTSSWASARMSHSMHCQSVRLCIAFISACVRIVPFLGKHLTWYDRGQFMQLKLQRSLWHCQQYVSWTFDDSETCVFILIQIGLSKWLQKSLKNQKNRKRVRT